MIDHLWLEFEDEGTLLLQCRSDGQGFELKRSEPEAAGGMLTYLAGEPPFAAVVGSALQTAGVITWPIHRRDEPERPPMHHLADPSAGRARAAADGVPDRSSRLDTRPKATGGGSDG